MQAEVSRLQAELRALREGVTDPAIQENEVMRAQLAE
jgi:hypothetical protein